MNRTQAFFTVIGIFICAFVMLTIPVLMTMAFVFDWLEEIRLILIIFTVGDYYVLVEVISSYICLKDKTR